jgi:hypothetical protein
MRTKLTLPQNGFNAFNWQPRRLPSLPAAFLGVFLMAVAPLLTSAAFAVDCGMPGVGFSYQPDDHGSGLAHISFAFPSAHDGNYVQLWGNGGILSTFSPTAATGTADIPVSVSCWSPGAQPIYAVAVSCGQWQDGAHTASSSTIVNIEKPTISGAAYVSNDLGIGTLSAAWRLVSAWDAATSGESRSLSISTTDVIATALMSVASRRGTQTSPPRLSLEQPRNGTFMKQRRIKTNRYVRRSHTFTLTICKRTFSTPTSGLKSSKMITAALKLIMRQLITGIAAILADFAVPTK